MADTLVIDVLDFILKWITWLSALSLQGHGQFSVRRGAFKANYR